MTTYSLSTELWDEGIIRRLPPKKKVCVVAAPDLSIPNHEDRIHEFGYRFNLHVASFIPLASLHVSSVLLDRRSDREPYFATLGDLEFEANGARAHR